MIKIAKKKSLTSQFIDITAATVLGVASIGVIGGSTLSAPLKTGTSSLIGVGLIKGASKIK